MSNRNFTIVIIMLTISIIIVFYQYLPHFYKIPSIPLSEFPDRIGNWKSNNNIFPAPFYKQEGDSISFVKGYVDEIRRSLVLSIVYSLNSRNTIHPPEIGLMGEGETIIEKSDERISEDLIATRIIVERKESRLLLVYWYKVGDIYTRSYLKQQVKLVMDRLLFKKRAFALITVSTEIQGESKLIALQRVKKFCKIIEPLLYRYIP